MAAATANRRRVVIAAGGLVALVAFVLLRRSGSTAEGELVPATGIAPPGAVDDGGLPAGGATSELGDLAATLQGIFDETVGRIQNEQGQTREEMRELFGQVREDQAFAGGGNELVTLPNGDVVILDPFGGVTTIKGGGVPYGAGGGSSGREEVIYFGTPGPGQVKRPLLSHPNAAHIRSQLFAGRVPAPGAGSYFAAPTGAGRRRVAPPAVVRRDVAAASTVRSRVSSVVSRVVQAAPARSALQPAVVSRSTVGSKVAL